jgi:hypothetical protein
MTQLLLCTELHPAWLSSFLILEWWPRENLEKIAVRALMMTTPSDTVRKAGKRLA